MLPFPSPIYTYIYTYIHKHTYGLPWCGSDDKESALNAGDLGLIPGSRRSTGEGNGIPLQYSSHQFSSVAQLCLILCDSVDCSTPGFPVHHQLLEPAQTRSIYIYTYIYIYTHTHIYMKIYRYISRKYVYSHCKSEHTHAY